MRHHDHGPGEDADHDGGHAVQQVRGVANHHRNGLAAEFGQIDAAQESHRNADHRRDQDQYGAAHDGVGHASAHLAGGQRQLGEEVPIQRAPPLTTR